MKKCILVTVRYSILFSKITQGFHMSAAQENYLSYKEDLFSPARMKMREFFFGEFLLKSINEAYQNNSHDVDFNVLVMASTELPEKNKKFLEDKAIEYSAWLHISYLAPEAVNYGAEMKMFFDEHYQGQKLLCATARLDDDDVLFKDYINVLSRYLTPSFDKSIISFSLGYNLYVEAESFNVIGASEYYKSKIAIGLACIRAYNNSEEVINDNIYKCGNHINVDKAYRVLDYTDQHAFVRINTELSDRMYRVDRALRNKRLYIEYRKQGDKRVGLGRVKKVFPLLPI